MKQTRLIPLLGLGLMLFLSKPHLIYGNSGYGGGSGTESDPYLISTPEHLNQLQLDVNVNGTDTTGKYYQLTNNIDLSGYDNDSDETNGNFSPIGYYISASDYKYFKGTFDGNGHTISNIEINLPTQNHVGFFGYTSSATIQNLGVENIRVEGKQYVGGLVGFQSGTISESYATGEVSGTADVGGLVGCQNSGTITQSYATGDVTGSSVVGGLVGYQKYGTVTQSYATGKVIGSGEDVGGLVGYNSGTISESYATGEVSGTTNVGGLVGYAYGSSNTTNSYWDVETSGQSSSQGGIGLTTEEMTKVAPLTSMTGFDFTSVWRTGRKYPELQWQPVSLEAEGEIGIIGTIEPSIADVTIPSVSPDLVIDPNSPDGAMSPEFEIQNESNSPIRLELKTFEQTTNTFNDVLPDKYSSWEGLNKTQSQDIALGLVAKAGDGWQRLTTSTSYVSGHTEHEIGVIKPTSQVNFEFDVHHGRAFSESKTVQYRLVFVFDLLS